MPISTRRSKEKELLSSDPERLERSICKEKRTSSIDTTSSSSINPYYRAAIDASTRGSIYIDPQADNMVATLVLTKNDNGDLHDPEAEMSEYLNLRLDFIYRELNRKFETLDAHVMMLDTQVSETAKAVRKHKALVKEKAEESERHQVEAILDDNFEECVFRFMSVLEIYGDYGGILEKNLDETRSYPSNQSRVDI
ncbi:hypothetical protein DY000_02021327 [Brassica cretica]|uniref:Uncharacterized protein n=1 Tax=Brassica cretica TaxID=69181 RepID=A0ABQ7E2T6_BRACR|nr:hypothetical protein DY000_02021327 [Brassica cretica]